MCGIIGGVSTLVVGSVLVVASSVISFVFVPNIIRNIIAGEVTLLDDTIQMERFKEVPFPMNFTVRVFNMTNPAQVLTGGVPVMQEIGPYVYRLYQTREILEKDGDVVVYKMHEHFEFDADLSYPYQEDDLVTIINVPFHAVIQVAESLFPYLMSLLQMAMDEVFKEFNTPITTIRVRDLLFDGITMCKNPTGLGIIACSIIRDIADNAQNIEEKPDGSLVFSILNYKQQLPSQEYRVQRGLNDPADLGRILSYAGSPFFPQWLNLTTREPNVCMEVNGTDAGIFAPFVETERSIYAINTDICRSVELRYERDSEYEGIPTVRFAANEWLLDNDDGCFCLNVTRGINRDDGCLLRGAMELYTCVGAFLIMSYPHFLFADVRYRDSVLGMHPNEENHKIFIELEPNTGTPIRGAKRAQFNIFSRPVRNIPVTQNLRTAIVPILWIEEAIDLPHEFVDELTERLLSSLQLVDIFIPVLIAACVMVLVVGVALTARARLYRK
ncbi:sensory neuron membrane protein 2 [Helicoverpa zea]|uniref:sensory neuron membrane protein 2 n=1 Tax=Helicoverpa zea TaxID=7113 RepID=UPI001F5A3BC1|nr:sensory neuron membrane protein 2 [Helicoverpa zea]